jgi:hypothetical protein
MPGHDGHVKKETNLPRRKRIDVQVVDEADGRFVIIKYADGAVEREAVDTKRKPTRKPRRPQQRLKTEAMNRTQKKSY